MIPYITTATSGDGGQRPPDLPKPGTDNRSRRQRLADAGALRNTQGIGVELRQRAARLVAYPSVGRKARHLPPPGVPRDALPQGADQWAGIDPHQLGEQDDRTTLPVGAYSPPGMTSPPSGIRAFNTFRFVPTPYGPTTYVGTQPTGA